MKKLYCYVDETGQDSKGVVFFVCCSIILSPELKEKIERKLDRIEEKVNKKGKWHKTKWCTKEDYLRAVLKISELRKNVYIRKFFNTIDYFNKTIEAIIDSLKFDKKYFKAKSVIIIDGLPRQSEPRVAKHLRSANLYIDKVRGLKDESSSLIRLSDALVGFARDFLKNKDYAKKYYPIFLNKGIIIEIISRKNKTPAKGDQS